MKKSLVEVESGCTVEYIEAFYSSDEANELLRALLAIRMEPEVVHMYGRDIVTGRYTEQYGRHYEYNRAAKKPREWTSLMASIRERVESIAGRVLFNSFPKSQSTGRTNKWTYRSSMALFFVNRNPEGCTGRSTV